jgi:hypothetical protein
MDRHGGSPVLIRVIDVVERYERTVNLETGTDAARWFDVDHRHEQYAEPVRVDQATTVTLRDADPGAH